MDFIVHRPKRKETQTFDDDQTNEDDNVTKSPAGSPSSSLESSKQTKKLHLDFDDAIMPDLVPRIVIEDNERNSSAEKTIPHESAISPELTNRFSNEQLVTVDLRTLEKILKKCQTHTCLLRELSRNQTKFEAKIEEKIDRVSDALKVLKEENVILNDVKGKSKSKPKDAFYYKTVQQLAYNLFHDHEQVSDDEIKKKLKEMLENDKMCADKLKELKKNGITYDKLWDDKLISNVLNTNRSKKGYYIRRVKESLWVIFGINRLKPFDENFTKSDMIEWKNSDKTKAAYEDLYSANNPESETYISLIIKNVFISEKEHTQKNAIWTQAILEIIFDETYLSPKIDSNTVNARYMKLTAAATNSSKDTSETTPKDSDSESRDED
ncbi:unnamed protein product [Rhizophagus irregularis]|nr:unnamed protein product [Rhizophagus irregularis]